MYKIKEAAEILGVTKQTIYNWQKKGYIKIVRFGGSARIKKEEVERIMRGE